MIEFTQIHKYIKEKIRKARQRYEVDNTIQVKTEGLINNHV